MSTVSSPESTFRGKMARRILFTMIPLIVVPVLLMGYAAYQRAKTLLQEQAAHQVQTLVASTIEDIDRWLVIKQIRADLALRRPAAQVAVDTLLHSTNNTETANARAWMATVFLGLNSADNLPIFNDFLIVNQEGRILASDRDTLIGQQIHTAPWWDTLTPVLEQQQDVLHFASSHLTPLLPDGRFGVVTVMRGPTSRIRDAIFIGLSYGVPVERFLQTPTLPLATTRAYFITQDGEWVYIDPLQESLVTEPLPKAIADQVYPLLARPTVLEYQNLQYSLAGAEEEESARLAVAGWLPRLRAGISVEVPQEALFARLHSLVPYTIILLALTTLFLAAVIWAATQTIVQPIQTLVAAARAVAEGDLRARAPVQRRDELGLLAYTFNHMADELSNLYRFLEEQVEQRTQQIQTAAEVAALATSATTLAEILQRTVNLIVERFPQYYQASIFLLDETGEFAVLRESAGPAAEELKRRGHRLQTNETSLVGWAAAHNQPRVASDTTMDPVHFKNPLLPETRSEAAIPIAVGRQVLGVLDVQSRDPNAFDEHALATLETLARQLAAAIYNARLLETTRFSLEETQALYLSLRDLSQAQTEEEIFSLIGQALQQSPFISAVFRREEGSDTFRPHSIHKANPDRPLSVTLPQEQLRPLFPRRAPLFLPHLRRSANLPDPLRHALLGLNLQEAALLPLFREGEIVGWIALGSPRAQGELTQQRLQLYLNLAELATNTLNRIHALQNAQLRLTELESLNRLSQALSTSQSLDDLYRAVHREIQTLFGDVAFVIALYHPRRQEVSFPYYIEQGSDIPISLPPIPLGEGLVSTLIQEKQPLLLNNTQEILQRGKHIGEPAKSWMGAPLIVGDEILGAILVEDIQQEGRFNPEQFNLFVTLAAQIALALRNLRLLERFQEQARRQGILLGAGERLRRTTDLQTILDIAVQELRHALNARRAMIRFQGLRIGMPSASTDGNGHSPKE